MSAVAFSLYNALLWLGSPFAVGYFFLKAWRGGRPLAGWRERLGAVPVHPPAGEGGRLWLHAVSVGEVGVAAALLPPLLRKRAGLRVALSTVTPTGRAEALKVPGRESVFYLPFDLPFAVRRALDRVRPDLLAVVETELWPNLIREADRRGIPVVVVNGRLSERSFRRYRRLRPLFGAVFRALAGVAARGEPEAERFRALGAPRVITAGNVKYDAPEPLLDEGLSETRRRFGLPRAGMILVAGSTHPGEEAAVAQAFSALRREVRGMSLLVAPRHLERLDQAEADLVRAGLEPVRWSRLERADTADPPPGRVVLLDVMGRLAEAYACATAAFIGGSLVPHGGQNPIEAARWGVPTVFGPHMENFAEVARDLVEGGGAVQVEAGRLLEWALAPWAADPGARDAAGHAAREVVRRNRGSAARTADFLFKAIAAARGEMR